MSSGMAQVELLATVAEEQAVALPRLSGHGALASGAQ